MFYKKISFAFVLVLLAGCASNVQMPQGKPTFDLWSWDTSSYFTENLVGKVTLYAASDLSYATLTISRENPKSKWYELGQISFNESIELSLMEGDYVIHAKSKGWHHKPIRVSGGKKTYLAIGSSESKVIQSPLYDSVPKLSGSIYSKSELELRTKATISVAYDLSTRSDLKPIKISVSGAVVEPTFNLNGQAIQASNDGNGNYLIDAKLLQGDNYFNVMAYGLDKKLVSQNHVLHIKTDKEIQDEIAAAKEAERAKAEELRQRQIQLEIQAQAKKAEEERIAREGDGSPDDIACKKYGLKPQTQGYAECRMRLDLSRKETERAKAINLANIKAIENARQADLQRRYEEEQRQKQMNANRESRCELLRAQEYLRPGNGSFADSAMSANNAYENCMAGVPQIRTTCTRDGYGNYSCTSR